MDDGDLYVLTQIARSIDDDIFALEQLEFKVTSEAHWCKVLALGDLDHAKYRIGHLIDSQGCI